MALDQVKICERWTFPVQEEAGGWFLEWARRKPAEVSQHLTAGLCAYLSLQMVYGPGEIRTAREYFGGLGAQALMIQEQFQPRDHVVLDISSDAARHLRQMLMEKPVWVSQADAYNPLNHAAADLVSLDYGDLTAWRLRHGEPQRRLLDKVMGMKPKAVVLTDVAGPRLHLHRERYASVIGSFDTYEEYLYRLSGWVHEVYGYQLLRGYRHRWSAVLSFVPGRTPGRTPGMVLTVPDRPVGLEFL